MYTYAQPNNRVDLRGNLIFKIIIFSAAAYILFTEAAPNSILTYLAAFKTVDFVIEEYIGVTIIAKYREKIRAMIIEKMVEGFRQTRRKFR